MLRLSPGTRYMVIAALVFSVMTVFVKVVGQTVPSGEVVFVRSAMTLAFSLWMVRRAGIRPLLGVNRRLLLFRGSIGFAGLICFFYAIPRLPLAEVTVIQYTNPVFVALFAALFLGEGLRGREVTGTVLCLVGVIVMAKPAWLFGAAPRLDGAVVLVALAGAVCAAAAYTSVRALRRSEHPLVVVLYFPLVSTPASAGFAVPGFVWPNAIEWLLLLGVGVTAQVAQVFMTRSFHAERAAHASTVSYLQIVFATLWGLLLFGEVPSVWTLIGSMLVVAGILATALSRRIERRNPSTAS